MLHPRVRGQDEVGREHRPQSGGPDCGQVQSLGQAIPSEDPQAKEGRLKEEGEQSLHRQRRAEHIADKSRVVRPIHAELELLNDAGHHTKCEVDQEQLAEELGESKVLLLACAHPCRLEANDKPHGPKSDRYEYKVVHRGHRELQTRQIKVHGTSSCLGCQQR